MTVSVLVLLHVLAAVLFVGNIGVGLFWVVRGVRSGDRGVLRHTFLSLDAADRWLTSLAVAGLLLTGFALALRLGLPLLGTGWLLWSAVAFALSGLAFVAGALPLQRRLANLGEEEASGPGGEELVRRLVARWSRWAHLSFLCALVALALMVLKPPLPGLGG